MREIILHLQGDTLTCDTPTIGFDKEDNFVKLIVNVESGAEITPNFLDMENSNTREKYRFALDNNRSLILGGDYMKRGFVTFQAVQIENDFIGKSTMVSIVISSSINATDDIIDPVQKSILDELHTKAFTGVSLNDKNLVFSSLIDENVASVVLPESGSDITELETRVSTLETYSDSFRVDIQALQEDNSTTQNKVVALENKTSQHDTDIEDLKTDVSSLNLEMGEIQDNILSLENNVNSLTSDFNTAKDDITSNSEQISTLSTQITTINTNLASLDNRFTVLENEVESLKMKTDKQMSVYKTSANIQVEYVGDSTNLQLRFNGGVYRWVTAYDSAEVNLSQTSLTWVHGRWLTFHTDTGVLDYTDNYTADIKDAENVFYFGYMSVENGVPTTSFNNGSTLVYTGELI